MLLPILQLGSFVNYSMFYKSSYLSGSFNAQVPKKSILDHFLFEVKRISFLSDIRDN